jgi:hypothetical protein
MPSTRRASSRDRFALPHAERQPAEIFAVAHEDVEGVELHLMIVPARMQAVEIRSAVAY